MRKILFIGLLMSGFFGITSAQSTYPSGAYAIAGDTVYMTEAAPGSFDFTTTGAGVTWDYSALTGNSQETIAFRDPKNTGFTKAQWNYLYNTSNVNLSSTNGQSIAIGPLQTDNVNDYYKLTNSVLQQSASSYNVIINDSKITIKNTYTSPDIIYVFPIAYQNRDSSASQYATNIPGFYYNSHEGKRVNETDGWGTVITPYGTFSNALRIVSTVNSKDSVVVYGVSSPAILSAYREIKWLDPSARYPVMIVRQNKVGSAFVTSSVSYLDTKRYFQPVPLFAYYPLTPAVGDTVHFQNLSSNGIAYQWNFDDVSAGASNTSTLYNPYHIYTSGGTYQVKLVVYNGELKDSITIPVNVSTTVSTQASFTYSPADPFTVDTVLFQNLSQGAVSYTWDFGDPSSGAENSSSDENPKHRFYTEGTYTVTLTAVNGAQSDVIQQEVVVLPEVVTPVFTMNKLSDVYVYPNPSSAYVEVICSEEIEEMWLVDLLDKEHRLIWSSVNTIDLSDFSSGIYLLKVKTGSEKIFMIKLIHD